MALIVLFFHPISLHFPLFNSLLINFIEVKITVLKAEQASRESRFTKQDHYAEMRRKKDEEREEQERLLVSKSHFLLNTLNIDKCKVGWNFCR